MDADTEHNKLEYRIDVAGELHCNFAVLAGCEIVVDDGRRHKEMAEEAPVPRYGCVATGPLSPVYADDSFQTYYWIHLLGADPETVPVPEFITLHVQVTPGLWKSQVLKVTPGMVESHTHKGMQLNLGKIEWIVV